MSTKKTAKKTAPTRSRRPVLIHKTAKELIALIGDSTKIGVSHKHLEQLVMARKKQEIANEIEG